MKGKAIYDFQGDTSQGELSFNEGDIITIVRQDIGEGWWEGQLSSGATGLLPASYIDIMEDTQASKPPPPPPASHNPPPPAQEAADEDDDDDWDDSDHDEPGWDEDDEEVERDDGHTPLPPRSQSTAHLGPPSRTQSISSRTKTGTMKKTGKGWIRSSMAVATGADEYLTSGGEIAAVNPSDCIAVVDTKGQGPGWAQSGMTQQVTIFTGAKKKGKGRGFSSYTHYNITVNKTTVERRMKHFQWLHDRLQMKYSCIAVPPLPDFKYLPKFREESGTKKVERLQAWIDRIMRHPVLGNDTTALKHFLEIEYEGNSWKQSKKKVDKDPLVGKAFFDLIRSDIELSPAASLKTIENFGKFQGKMRTCVEKVQTTSLQHSNRMFSGIRKEYTQLSESMNKLADVVGEGAGTDGNAVKLSMALRNCGGIFSDIGEHTARQPINDEIPWMENLKEYQSLMGQFDGAVKSSIAASKKFSALALMEGKHGEEIPVSEKEAYKSRLDNINTVTLCEIHNFHEVMKKDFKKYMQNYLQAKMDYHQQLMTDFQAAKTAFDSLPYD